MLWNRIFSLSYLLITHATLLLAPIFGVNSYHLTDTPVNPAHNIASALFAGGEAVSQL
ncbi:TPA: hypothetical protein QCX07_003923 [Bacillus cytotoxicus]|nr:hypothetical protein [Bacillus cytotoxicus]HDR7213837.1 hypothetical protein [Bacillus cytotoxicus]HDR7297054.1 hypothetical protein [Bacillus cytotoxicus]HDR7314660.1 hypothetical protein [Bacillus cytotoxicus]HDR7879018.1 hypothetical protein [Bacillus cytotoxicus]